MASILEYEANRSEDYPKVARVLYNRLNKGMPLQLDSTVAYVSQRSGDVWTTAAERADDSAYNTYAHTGSASRARSGLRARRPSRRRSHRPRASWLYFVPDYEAETTRFSTTLKEHNKWVDEAARVLPQERGLLSDDRPTLGLDAARCWVRRSRTRSHRHCTGRRTPSSGSTGPMRHVLVDSAGLEGFDRRARRLVARAVADDAAQAHRRTPPGHQRRVGAPVGGREHGRPRPRWRPGSRHGFNTDIPGAIGGPAGAPARTAARSAVVLGGGATAASVLLALAELGCTTATVLVRDPARAEETVAVVSAHPHAPELSVDTIEGASRVEADLLVTTIPARGADTRTGRPVLRTSPPSSRSSTTRGPPRSPGRRMDDGRHLVERARPARAPGRGAGAADDRARRSPWTCSARRAAASWRAGLCRSTPECLDSPSLRAWTGSNRTGSRPRWPVCVACAALGWFVPAMIARDPGAGARPDCRNRPPSDGSSSDRSQRRRTSRAMPTSPPPRDCPAGRLRGPAWSVPPSVRVSGGPAR